MLRRWWTTTPTAGDTNIRHATADLARLDVLQCLLEILDIAAGIADLGVYA
jgi:hypothetical protein